MGKKKFRNNTQANINKRYSYAPYVGTHSKSTCPACKVKHKWVRYIDNETSKLLSINYGKCDRIEKCGYHFSPYAHPPTETTNIVIPVREEVNYFNIVPESILLKSLEHQFSDNFSQYILSKFTDEAKSVLESYDVGYSKAFNGAATVFWQQDILGRIRSGKIIKYSEEGKRLRGDTPSVTWVHKSFDGDFVLKQCFFGEHLLSTNLDKTVCIVEAEKTAIIGSILKPEYIWLAATQLQGLNLDKLKALSGRNVVFYPDKGKAYNIWKDKLKNWRKNLDFSFVVSNFVEKAKELKEGDDLADLLLKKI